MPDITMCGGFGCPGKNKCYRYTTTPTSQRQSYFIEAPVVIEDNRCDYYWEANQEKTNEK